MPTVRLDKVSLAFGLKPLLDLVDLQVRKGERVCLLGRNGEGKSSLLQLITRQIVPDGGEVWVRPGARVASLAQEVSAGSDASVYEVIRGGVPSFDIAIPGCRFADRCPLADADCRAAEPALREVAPAHFAACIKAAAA